MQNDTPQRRVALAEGLRFLEEIRRALLIDLCLGRRRVAYYRVHQHCDGKR